MSSLDHERLLRQWCLLARNTIRCSICVDSKTLQSVNPAQPCLTYDGTSGFPYSSIGGMVANVICLPQSSGGGSLPCDIYCPTRAADAGLLQRDTATATPDTAADAAPFTPERGNRAGAALRFCGSGSRPHLRREDRRHGRLLGQTSLPYRAVVWSPPVMGTVSSVGVGDSFLCAVRPGGSFLCCGDILYGSRGRGSGHAVNHQRPRRLRLWCENRWPTCVLGEVATGTARPVRPLAASYLSVLAITRLRREDRCTVAAGATTTMGIHAAHRDFSPWALRLPTCGVKTGRHSRCWGSTILAQSRRPQDVFIGECWRQPHLRREDRRHGRLLGDFGRSGHRDSNTTMNMVRPQAHSYPSALATTMPAALKTDGTVACWGDNLLASQHHHDEGARSCA